MVETLAIIAAGIAVVATIVYVVLLSRGVRTLKDIRDTLRDKR